MPSSLLPESHTAATQALTRADTALTRLDPAWPQGHPTARLVEEYLVGRMTGVVDVSGRPRMDAAIPEAGAAPEAAASPTAVALSAPVTVVLDDPTGALILVAVLTGAPRVHVWCDSAQAEIACREAFAVLDDAQRGIVTLHPTRADALQVARTDALEVARTDAAKGPTDATGRPTDAGAGAEGPTDRGVRVLVEAPKQVAVLRQLLLDGARTAAEVVVAGRDKHLSPRFNSILGEAFEQVHISPGRAKSRLLIGASPKSTARPGGETTRQSPATKGSAAPHDGAAPADDRDDAPGWARAVAASPAPGVPEVAVSAWPGTFGGAGVDPGSRLLVRALADRAADSAEGVSRVLDLGCGNGWLLAALGSLAPGAQLAGVDDSQAAVSSATRTVGEALDADGSGRRAVLVHADGTRPLPWTGATGEEIAAGSFDLVTLNPPFHEGHAVTTDSAHALIDAAVELLAPGGRLVVVHNAHLRYRSHLAHRLDGVEQWARDRRFIVLSGLAPAR